MGKTIDITGQTFGKLAVLKQGPLASNRKAQWWCKCNCGNPKLKLVRGDRLRSGGTKSCGECNKFELIGKTFGKLTVLEVDLDYNEKHEIKNKDIYFKCQCSCSNQSIISTTKYRLTSGITKSCGCYNGESKRKDIANQKFGKLTALYPTEKRFNGKVVWFCACDCGGTKEVGVDDLTCGEVKSCGCLRSSGEDIIQTLLRENNISFEKEKSFSELKNPETNMKLYYDFYLPEYNRLIEFDGEQHFSLTGGWNNEEHFNKIKLRDELKNNYALLNNIELARIPYWKKESLTLDDLLGKQYLIKK